MTLRVALDEYKRDRADDTAHPGERRSDDGLFSGDDGRLVYVDRAGPVRDYSDATMGMHGVERSRFGVAVDGEVTWFDELDTTRQHYDDDTTVVVTEHDAGSFRINQYDYTIERAHLTHVELKGSVPSRPELVAALTFAPDGQDRSVGQLRHEDVVEVFHDAEHDYVTASTGLKEVTSRETGGFDALLDDGTNGYPPGDRESGRLADTVVATVPFDDEGDLAQTTLVTLVADHRETNRADALAHARAFADHYQTDRAIRTRAGSRRTLGLPDVPYREALVDDLRVLDLLTGSSGGRIKGPECDPYQVYSGGYGYTWFRDDAEIARSLLTLDRTFELELGERHQSTAEFYRATQLPDGTWPQRVWAHSGDLAPGWGHARVERGGTDHQPDQTASVVAYLATFLRRCDPEPGVASAVESTIADGVDALCDLLGPDDLPLRSQNVWEDGQGRFTHAAATFCRAFAAVARAPVDPDLAEHATERAGAVFESLDDRWLGERYAHSDDSDALDASTLELVDAHAEYAALVGSLSSERLERLRTHVETTVDGLTRDLEDGTVGLARYEGDRWRSDGDAEKVWPLATAWGAAACADLAELLDDHGVDATDSVDRSLALLEGLLPDGGLCQPTGYLSEQVYADGRPDSAVPLGWVHGLRLGVLSRLAALGELTGPTELAQPTGPAERATWTTGEKYGIGTAHDHHDPDPSRVWFTLTEGALTEPRFPRVDLMNFRTVDFLVVDADPDSTYTARTHNERRTDDEAETIERETTMADSEAPVYRQRIREAGGNGHEWELTVETLTDPDADSIVLDVSFTALDDNSYDVYVVGDAAPSGYVGGSRAERLEDGSGDAVGTFDTGHDDAVVVDENGEPYAVAAAMASRRSFDWATVGHAGADHLRSLFADGVVEGATDAAGPGNVVLVGRLGSRISSVADTVAVGFAEGADLDAALATAQSSLERGYVDVRDAYVSTWHEYLADRGLPASVRRDPKLANQYRAAVMTLKAVEDKTFRGAGIASPSVPWGDGVDAAHPRDYGYNFSWARDLYQVFTALEAVGDLESAIETTAYIYRYQQRENGFIPQNTYLDGRTRWGGEQLDNIAFPSVMAYQLAERHGIDLETAPYEYEHVKRSVEYCLRSGPRSGQERWEEEAGYSPSTIAAQIAGIGCGAALAATAGEEADAIAWLAHADEWRLGVDDWCATTTGTGRHEHTPYYVRVTRSGDPESGVRRELANNGPTLDERDVIDAGFLELVRLGLRDPEEAVIENSVAEVDETIRVTTPNGPGWYRYNGDGYGELGTAEHDEGAPWDMGRQGQGRLWPIFTGERAEYELVRGTDEGPHAPQRLLETMANFANSARMIPEQVWDREYPTEFGWEFGEGTGAATPLAWSMAQFVRLAHGIDAGEPIETPRILRERYDGGAPEAPELTVEHDGSRLVGETTGDRVVLWSPAAGARAVDVEDGAFDVELDAVPAAGVVTVVAARTAPELADLGTAIERVDLHDTDG